MPYYLEKWNAAVYGVLRLTCSDHATAIVGNSSRINKTHLLSPSGVTSGVPQGSIVNPISFVLFVNDLQKYLKNYLISQNVDDTTCIVSETSISAIAEPVSGVVTNMTWCIKNNLVLNSNKTNLIHFAGGVHHYVLLQLP